MPRVFLDANVLFSAAYRDNAGLRRLWRPDRFRLVTSDYAAQEAAANLVDKEQRVRLAKLIEAVEVVSHSASAAALPAGVRLPEKDVPILQAAMQAGAEVLLTGDVAHFGRYFGRTLGGVRILSPAEFMREMER